MREKRVNVGPEPVEFGKRWAKALAICDLTQAKAAALLGVTQSLMSRMCIGASDGVSITVLIRGSVIFADHGVSLDWLLLGRGAMMRQGQAADPHAQPLAGGDAINPLVIHDPAMAQVLAEDLFDLARSYGGLRCGLSALARAAARAEQLRGAEVKAAATRQSEIRNPKSAIVPSPNASDNK